MLYLFISYHIISSWLRKWNNIEWKDSKRIGWIWWNEGSSVRSDSNSPAFAHAYWHHHQYSIRALQELRAASSCDVHVSVIYNNCSLSSLLTRQIYADSSISIYDLNNFNFQCSRCFPGSSSHHPFLGFLQHLCI